MSYYVTTSIPYANADPHIGFAMELIQGDVLARYARQQDETTLFVTGTDEHGTKIYEKAKEQGIEPRELTDKMSENFRSLGRLLDSSHDRFIRTTDESHEKRAQIVWKALEDDIYKASYKGLYCVGCEAFVTEATAKENDNQCPDHQKPYQALEEDNYFFRLSKYANDIKSAIMNDEFRILPAHYKNEILEVVKKGLDDISVSRPVEKLPWGVPVPDDKTQVMYVWFEALMNYITVLGYPEHDDFKTFWPADVQVIGKDILRFHAAIWPGMLLGIGVPLPKTLYVHGFITSDSQKMSKSIGNVVHPKEAVDIYGTDALRYYLLRHIPSAGDGDFTWEKFHDAYTNELGNDLGNSVQRTVAMIVKYLDGKLFDVEEASHDVAAYHEAMAECQFDRALDTVWLLIKGLSQYIDGEKPWLLAKEADKSHLQEVLRYQASSLLQIAGLLQPFLPTTAQAIDATLKADTIRLPETTLFPRVDLPTDGET